MTVPPLAPGLKCQHDRAINRWALYLAAIHRLIKRDGQVHPDMVAIAPEEGMLVRLSTNTMPSPVTARPGMSFTLEPHLRAVFDPARQFQIDRLCHRPRVMLLVRARTLHQRTAQRD